MGKKRCSRCKKVRPVDVVVKDLEGKIKEHLCHACSHKVKIKAVRTFNKTIRVEKSPGIAAWDMGIQNERHHGEEVICEVCLDVFTKQNKGHKYCSLECKKEAKRLGDIKRRGKKYIPTT